MMIIMFTMGLQGHEKENERENNVNRCLVRTKSIGKYFQKTQRERLKLRSEMTRAVVNKSQRNTKFN